MAKFKYVGDPKHGGNAPSGVVEMRGYNFTKGEVTEVPDSDKESVERLSKNSHFELVSSEYTGSGETPAVPQPAEPQPSPKPERRPSQRIPKP